MSHGRWIVASALMVLASSGVRGETPCYVVDGTGHEHWITNWGRFVAREIEPNAPDETPVDAGGSLYSPGVLNAFLYRGAVIPVDDVRYLLPSLGVYVLEDGHRIEASPLSHCGFSREHRFVDLEHPRHRSTAAGIDKISHPRAPLALEVYLEFAVSDTVAGYPVAEPGTIAISDAWIVALDPSAVGEARRAWAEGNEAAGSGILFSPYVTVLGRRTDLFITPGGEATAGVKKGARVEVLENRGDWTRVRLEGWVKREDVEEDRP